MSCCLPIYPFKSRKNDCVAELEAQAQRLQEKALKTLKGRFFCRDRHAKVFDLLWRAKETYQEARAWEKAANCCLINADIHANKWPDEWLEKCSRADAAFCYMMLRRHQTAAELFLKIANPKEPQLFMYAAEAYEMMGHKKLAKMYYTKAQVLFSDLKVEDLSNHCMSKILHKVPPPIASDTITLGMEIWLAASCCYATTTYLPFV